MEEVNPQVEGNTKETVKISKRVDLRQFYYESQSYVYSILKIINFLAAFFDCYILGDELLSTACVGDVLKVKAIL